MASDMQEAQRPRIQVEVTTGKAFEEKLANRKLRNHPFFFTKPPAVLDARQVPLGVKIDSGG